MSIQQSLDGHSFSLPAQDIPINEPVAVELLTLKTMLVPAQTFDETGAGALLAANGMPAGADECIVCSDPEAAIIAIMAIPAETLHRLYEKYAAARCRFTTPLLHVPAVKEPFVWIYRAKDLLYVKVYDKGLQLAEVISAPDETEIRYFFERLTTLFPLRRYSLLIAGDKPQRMHKVLGKGFSETSCE